jgi:probable blue pigment (indigoidine) exporter
MATGVWLTRRWQINLPVMALTGWQLVLGGMMLAPAAWLIDAPLPTLTTSQYAAYTYLSVAGAFVAYGLWFRGITRLPGVAVASLGLLSPLAAVLLGWLVLSQVISGTAFAGFAIVLASVLVVQRTSARTP